MKNITIALVGQPNVGKSMLINAISNAKLKVGNFSGVTVEKKEVEFDFKEYHIKMIDLPGIYSLKDYTIEEKVTKKFLLEEEYDLIINVVDATSLEKNFLLTAELMELEKKMIIALNMMDEAHKEGIIIDNDLMSEILNIPCLKISAAKQRGIGKLLNKAIEIVSQPLKKPKLIFSDTVEEEIDKIANFLKEKGYKSEISYRELAIKLLEEDKIFYNMMREEPIWIELLPIIREALEHLYIHYETKNVEEIFAQERASFVRGVLTETVKYQKTFQESLTDKIDAILIHPIFGIPIFLFFMWLLFQATFEFGNYPMELIDSFFSSIIDHTKEILGEGMLSSVIADGAIAGVGAVVSFLPNIVILFLGIALLETTGYMARVAFLLDGFFHKFGLHGKSFIPLVTGFGCSVPAYMAARTLKNHTDRLITLFIIGFMSCGARLPIYVLFTGAFFPEEVAGNILFLIYITGALFGLVAAKVLKMFVFKGKDEPFVMEMPKYRLPSLKLIWHTVFTQAWMYLKKAGTFILAASVLVWFASNFPKYPELEQQYAKKIETVKDESKKESLENELQAKLLEKSYLGQIGKATEPFFAPLGFDWKLSVALEAGLAAKEVVVSTLGVLYALGETDETSQGLKEQIKKNIPLPVAIAFIVFVMLYLPCFAASVVFTKEAGGVKYLVYLFIMTTATAWMMSFIAYNTTKMIL